jgi:predicted amidohydrolase
MIIDPWGKILAEIPGEGTEPEIAVADLDLEYRGKICREMPLLRRT